MLKVQIHNLLMGILSLVVLTLFIIEYKSFYIFPEFLILCMNALFWFTYIFYRNSDPYGASSILLCLGGCSFTFFVDLFGNSIFPPVYELTGYKILIKQWIYLQLPLGLISTIINPHRPKRLGIKDIIGYLIVNMILFFFYSARIIGNGTIIVYFLIYAAVGSVMGLITQLAFANYSWFYGKTISS